MHNTKLLITLINGYKISYALFIAAEFNLFDYIDGKRTVQEIADIIVVDSRALEIILDLFASVGLLEKKQKYIYFMKDDILPLLDSHSNNSFIPLMRLESYLSDKHTSKDILREVIQNGKGYDLFNQNSKENQEELYGVAMDHGSKYSSICCARELLGIKKGRVLDVGGGIGSYAIQLCKMNKDIEVDIIDKPEMEKECLRHISDNNLSDRITFYPGDIRQKTFLVEYEGIIVSNVLHLFDEMTNKKIIEKLSLILKDKGIIVFHDFFLPDDKTSSPVPSLFTLDWLMHGTFFNASYKDLSDWVKESGLRVLKIRNYEYIPTSIIIVQKST